MINAALSIRKRPSCILNTWRLPDTGRAAYGRQRSRPTTCCASQIHQRVPASRSRGAARQAIFMVEPAQDRRGDHLRVCGKPITGARDLIRVRDRLWNAWSEAGVWATAIVVGHPFAKDQAEMSLVNGDQPIQTLPTQRPDHSFAERIGLRCPPWRLEHMPPHRRDRPANGSACRA